MVAPPVVLHAGGPDVGGADAGGALSVCRPVLSLPKGLYYFGIAVTLTFR